MLSRTAFAVRLFRSPFARFCDKNNKVKQGKIDLLKHCQSLLKI